MISPIKSERLRLESLSVECLQALAGKDWERVEKVSPFKISAGTSLLGQTWIERRLNLIKIEASQHPWLYRAIVREADNEMVGYISCHHGFPDPDLSKYSDCGVEFGYTIEPQFRRLGYARESILALITWAQTEQTSVEIFVSVSPTNKPSMALALSLGFVKRGEELDDVDGVEHVLQYQP